MSVMNRGVEAIGICFKVLSQNMLRDTEDNQEKSVRFPGRPDYKRQTQNDCIQ